MFYSIRFNSALAAMNVDPTSIPPSIRQMGQDIGNSHGLTPQEAALTVVAEVFGIDYPMNADIPLAVQVWTRDRKIFPNKPEVHEALIALNLF
jgi:hypothetical protein